MKKGGESALDKFFYKRLNFLFILDSFFLYDPGLFPPTHPLHHSAHHSNLLLATGKGSLSGDIRKAGRSPPTRRTSFESSENNLLTSQCRSCAFAFLRGANCSEQKRRLAFPPLS